MHLDAVDFGMRAESACRERSEKRSPQLGALGREIDRAGDVPHAKADLATLPILQCLLEALSLGSRKNETRPQLWTHCRSEERIRIAGARQFIVEASHPPCGPMQ